PAQRGRPRRRLHVPGERPGPRRHRGQGHAAGRGDQRRLLGPDRLHRRRRLSLPDSRALRDGGRRRIGPVPRGPAMSGFTALHAVLLIPALAAGVLTLIPGYRISAAVNVLASLATLIAAASLFIVRPPDGLYLRVDDLSVVFIVLSAFV